MQKIFVVFTLILFYAINLQAHGLWVNVFESTMHPPGHAFVSLGWGHKPPLDDMPNSASGMLIIESFSVTEPGGEKIQLYKPEPKTAKPFIIRKDMDIFKADLACQKIAFKEPVGKGMYLVEATSKKTFYTQYIDTKGRKRLALKPKDAIEDIKNVNFSVQYQSFAKSYLSFGEWKQPRPTGHALEIIPLSDLSQIKTGDLVKFKVLFNGEPLSSTASTVEYLTAYSPSFGISENFALYSPLLKGKAQFRIQSRGQWFVNIFYEEKVTPEGRLKQLYKQTNDLHNVATLSFVVE